MSTGRGLSAKTCKGIVTELTAVIQIGVTLYRHERRPAMGSLASRRPVAKSLFMRASAESRVPPRRRVASRQAMQRTDFPLAFTFRVGPTQHCEDQRSCRKTNALTEVGHRRCACRHRPREPKRGLRQMQVDHLPTRDWWDGRKRREGSRLPPASLLVSRQFGPDSLGPLFQRRLRTCRWPRG